MNLDIGLMIFLLQHRVALVQIKGKCVLDSSKAEFLSDKSNRKKGQGVDVCMGVILLMEKRN